MKQELEYADFDVVLERRGEGYIARVVDSPVGGVGPEDIVPPNVSGLTTLVGQMSALRRITPVTPEEAATPLSDAPKALGTQLFDALFTGQIRFALRNSLYVAATHHQGLRLRLGFVGTPELASLPWELLYDKERRFFPCRLKAFPTVRVVEVSDPIVPLALAGPIRILVVISSPANLHQLDVEAEWARLEAALHPLTDVHKVELVRLGGASLESLRAAVTESDFHVFHFMGHGGVDHVTGEGQLAFTSATGLAQFEPSSHLAAVLAYSPIELAVLNSCEGGRVTAIDPYGSTALTLVEHGIPAVVAMQFEISDEAAKAFSGVLYQHVTGGEGVDLAVTLGRQAILTTSPSEWSTPVLYRRSGSTTLFERQPPPPPLPPPRPRSSPEPPRIVSAAVKGATVSLAWHQPQVAGATVTQWEVSRNGVPHAVVYQPGFIDTPAGPGLYTYSVIARANDQGQSAPSDDATVKVRDRLHRWFFNDRGRPRVAVWLFAAFMAFTFVLAIVVGATPVPAPTNVQVTSTDPITLVWDSDPVWRPVDEWEVFRDGELVGTTKTPSWRDRVSTPGTHRYTIWAVDSSGQRSTATTVTVTAGTPP